MNSGFPWGIKLVWSGLYLSSNFVCLKGPKVKKGQNVQNPAFSQPTDPLQASIPHMLEALLLVQQFQATRIVVLTFVRRGLKLLVQQKGKSASNTFQSQICRNNKRATINVVCMITSQLPHQQFSFPPASGVEGIKSVPSVCVSVCLLFSALPGVVLKVGMREDTFASSLFWDIGLKAIYHAANMADTIPLLYTTPRWTV